MRKNKELTYLELNVFCEQMSMILKSGISVYEGILILRDENISDFERDVFTKILEELDLGIGFPDALASTKVFPEYMITMVNIGDMSGRLDDVLQQLSHFYTREEKIKQAIKHAVFYPATMVAIMVLVIGVLMIKVIPIFSSVFVQLGSELAGFSKTVMDMGILLTRYSGAILGVIVLFSLVMLWLFKSKSGAKYGAKLKASFFLTRKLSEQIATARFAGGMSLMLASGLDTDKSIEMAEMLIDNDGMCKKVTRCRTYMAEGVSFADAIAQSEIFRGIYGRMLAVGIKTGATDEVMNNISQRYEEEIDSRLSSIVGIIEPSLVAFLSIVVGMVLLSVMLPLMGIMSTI